MKRFYGTYILAFIAVLLIAYTVFYQYEQRKEKPKDEKLLPFDKSQIAKILIRNKEKKTDLVLYQIKKTWKLRFFPSNEVPIENAFVASEVENSYDASLYFASTLVEKLLSLQAMKQINASEQMKEEYGLKEPSEIILVELYSGDKCYITVGNQHIFKGLAYVEIEFSANNKQPYVYLVSGSLLPDNKLTLDGLRSKELSSFLAKDIISIEILKNQTKNILLKKSLVGWTLFEPIIDDVNELEVNKLVGTLTTSSVQEFIKDHFDDKDIKKYKFHKPLLELQIKLKEKNEKVVFKFASYKRKILVANYRKLFIAEIVPEIFDKLNHNLQSLREDKFMRFNKWEVSRLDVQWKNFNSLSLKSDNKWESFRIIDRAGEKEKIKLEVEEDEINVFLDSLQSEVVQEYVYNGKTPVLKQYGLGDPLSVIEIYVRLNNGKERSIGKLYLGKQFSKHRKKYHYVRRDKHPYVYSIREEFITTIPKQYMTDHEEIDKDKKEILLKGTGRIYKLNKAFTQKNKKYRAVIKTSKGNIEIELFHLDAPYTVSNFLNLARNNFYTKMKFHRVSPGFIVQTGDPTNSGRGGPGYTFIDEKNNRKHLRGSIAMAKTSNPNSNGSQFFICMSPQPHLDGRNTVFAKVTDGMQVVDSLTEEDTLLSIEAYEVRN